MIGAGVGVTPLRAMLEDLPLHVDTVLLARAHDERGLVLREELAQSDPDAREGGCTSCSVRARRPR